jgi:hypothetical protein
LKLFDDNKLINFVRFVIQTILDVIWNCQTVFLNAWPEKVGRKTPRFKSWLIIIMNLCFHKFFIRLILPIRRFPFRRTSTGRGHLVQTFVIRFLVMKMKMKIVGILDMLRAFLWKIGLKCLMMLSHLKLWLICFEFYGKIILKYVNLALYNQKIDKVSLFL